MLWAILPAAVLLLAFGDSGPLALLLGTAALALVLRLSVNLPLTILASVPVGLVTGAAVAVFGGAVLEQMTAVFDQFLTSVEQQMAPAGGDGEVTLLRPTALQVAGMLGVANGLLSVLCLLLARWWQAALYNPGGFAAEFRRLYYPPAISALLLLAALGLASLGVQWRPWAAIFLLPLTFAGLALLHAWQALRGGGRGLLVGFYLSWVIFDLVKILVVVAAVAGSWLQWRQRWAARAGTDVDRRDDNDSD
ncbi:hypothetical protein [Kineobactrum salinum]|uniref:hypothetical protein n=1 Tax=Kineobactrum salinum TaxID=2708301 RepID=UPI001E4C9877|nr:hypothetical protein [Kineobactrum salinum]